MSSQQSIDIDRDEQSTSGFEAAISPPTEGRRWSTLAWLRTTLDREMDERRGALWIPVLFGVGVLVYFGLPVEPPLVPLVLAAVIGIAGTVWTRHRATTFRIVLTITTVIAGLSYMAVRTHVVATPMVASEYIGTLTGWVEALERNGPRDVRIVVRVRSLEDLDPAATPRKVRITVRGQFDGVEVGAGISGLVGLQPPAAPVMPGGYDFGRELFYQGIGASGFAYGPPDIVDIGPPPFSIRWRVPVERLRASIGAHIEALLPGDGGQIANALITGDQGGISDETTNDYRVSGLTHILSISGLHMSLAAGAVFFTLRALLALIPILALRFPIKKWAASGALLMSTFYLLLSGAEVATQRSFLMLAVILVAVILDRRAFSIRNIATAAAIVLVLTPEAILTASFQMSFAATLALIAGFEFVSDRRRKRLAIGPAPRWNLGRRAWLWFAGSLLTSILAGLATAPYGAFNFNRTQPLSLIANLMAIPAISFLVMPAALVAMLLMPLGFDGPALQVMNFGLDLVARIATMVTAWTGDAGMVAASPMAALLIASIGIVWLCLWRQRWRLLGLAGIFTGIALAGTAAAPSIMTDETGAAVMVRGPDGAYRFMGKGATFEQETWLRADADLRLPGDPSLADGIFCDSVGCTAPLGDTGQRVSIVTDARAFADDCHMAIVVVTALIAPANCAATVVDAASLARDGATALYLEKDGAGFSFRVTGARPPVRRLWMPPVVPPQ